MIKKFLVLMFCAFMLSFTSAHAQDFPTLRNSVVEVINGDHIGSGVVIGKNKVLTAAHVVDDNKTVMINIYGSTMDVVGKVVKKDKQQDWAIIEVATGTIPVLQHTCLLPRYGEPVSMIGFPLGIPFLLMQGYAASNELFENHGGEYIFLDIRINHGNSGGPVFNKTGQVIGIAVAGVSPAKDSEGNSIGVMSPLFKFCKELD